MKRSNWMKGLLYEQNRSDTDGFYDDEDINP